MRLRCGTESCGLRRAKVFAAALAGALKIFMVNIILRKVREGRRFVKRLFPFYPVTSQNNWIAGIIERCYKVLAQTFGKI